MSYRIYRFGDTQLIPDYDARQEIGTGMAQIESIDGPRGGAFDSLGTEQAFRGGFAVKTTGIMAAATSAALKTEFDALRAYLGKRQKLWRRDDAGEMQWAWARLVAVNVTREAKNQCYLEMDLSFYVYSAVWNGDNHGVQYFDSGLLFDDGLFFDDNEIYPLGTSPTTVTLSNDGNATIRNFEFAFTPKVSPITALKIEVSGKISISWAGTLAVDTQLVFDFGAMGISNNGVNAYSGLTLNADHKIDDWARLEPGDTTFLITRTGGSASSELAVSYYDGWV